MGLEETHKYKPFTQYKAFCPLKWNSGLILCLLNRAKQICSSDALFREETVKLKTIFKANDYPKFFDKILQQFLKSDKKQASDSTQTSQSAHEYPIVVPYLGKDSRRFVNKFSKIIKDPVPKLAPPEPPTGGGLAQKGGPVNSQYVVLFTQRMIKVP